MWVSLQETTTRFIHNAAVVVVFSTATVAKPPMREVKQINDGLLAVGFVDEIRKNAAVFQGDCSKVADVCVQFKETRSK